MFLDMKMLHGTFRERGTAEEYKLFMQICKKVRKMYLLAYSAIDNRNALEVVHKICFDFLYLFGVRNHIDVKFE